MQRKWIVHIGPTNSGKTYQALSRLAHAENGVYCGPLRLLAWEVHEKLCDGAINGRRVACDLLTGQEQVLFANAMHRASTIEMVDLKKCVEVAVIDEVQMVASPDRGWAWTRALLGIPARELHLCGEARALPLLERLCALCGDALEVREYTRLSPLKVARQSLGGSLRNVQAGDCVVAFSRKYIHRLKREIELQSPHRCCVVYGSLPPETRKEQARLFNERHPPPPPTPPTPSASGRKSRGKADLDPYADRRLHGGAGGGGGGSGFGVLVASDAVGMGLNLEIRRVVFSSVEKFDGVSERPLTTSEILQIGGRAGRFSSTGDAAVGEVTTLHEHDLPLIADAFQGLPEPLGKACLRPEVHMLEDFARGLAALWQRSGTALAADGSSADEKVPLHDLLTAFQEVHTADEQLFFLTDSLDEMKALAAVIEDVDLPMAQLFTLCMAPADADSAAQRGALQRFARRLSSDGRVGLLRNVEVRRRVPSDALELKEAEDTHTVLELYVWLSQRLGNELFPDADLARTCVVKSNALIQAGLQRITLEQHIEADDSGSPVPLKKRLRQKAKLQQKQLKAKAAGGEGGRQAFASAAVAA